MNKEKSIKRDYSFCVLSLYVKKIPYENTFQEFPFSKYVPLSSENILIKQKYLLVYYVTDFT